MSKPALPSTVQNVFTTDAVAMLVGKGEHQMRILLRHNAAEFPEPRYVPAYVVGNHAGRAPTRVFTAEDVQRIREVLDVIKARKKAAWEARMIRRRLRNAGSGVEAWRHRSRQGPYGERPGRGPDGPAEAS